MGTRAEMERPRGACSDPKDLAVGGTWGTGGRVHFGQEQGASEV